MAERSDAERLRTKRIVSGIGRVVGSLAFGICAWAVLQLAIGGLECTKTYSPGTGITRLILATIVEFYLFVPGVAIVAALGYLTESRTALAHRPDRTFAAAAIVLVLLFFVALSVKFLAFPWDGRSCDLS